MQEVLRCAARDCRSATCWVLVAASACATPARASFLSGEALDTAADILAVVILFVVPIVGIVVFWLVHILPEKVAENRHHPQKDAIKTLCLLSLLFGGMLWPIAWLWAYTRPVLFKAAYGVERHESYFEEMAQKARAGESTADEILQLLSELEQMRARGVLPAALRGLPAELESLRERVPSPAPAAPPAEGR